MAPSTDPTDSLCPEPPRDLVAERRRRVLVEAAELRGLVDRDEVTVLDVRYRLGGPPGAEEFARGHVPGAAYVDLETDLAGPAGEGGRHPLPDVEVWVSALRRAGVSGDRPVVVYDDWAGRAAARCWWLLRHHGHGDVRVLDGGWSAWSSSGGELETGRAVPREEGDLEASGGAGMTLAAEDVPTFLSGGGVLLDARQPERFRGETEPVDPVAGHVPGATNVPTTSNLVEGTDHVADAATLAEVYRAAGAIGEAPVAAYCGSGVTATHDLLALASLGVEGLLYAGSWSHWVTDPERPVATGD